MSLRRTIVVSTASGIPMCLAIVYIVWWQLAHNFINNSCPNNLYQARHLAACATWNRASGIVMGITVPIIVLGILGVLGSWLVWFVGKMYS